MHWLVILCCGIGQTKEYEMLKIRHSESRLLRDLEKAGGKLIGGYYTMGKYDGVIILEAPNDEVVMKIMLATASLGNIRTKTLKAFPHEEGAKMMDNL